MRVAHSKYIRKASEIAPIVHEALEKTLGRKMLVKTCRSKTKERVKFGNIDLQVLDKLEYAKVYGNCFGDDGGLEITSAFCTSNYRDDCQSQIFACEGNIVSVVSLVSHELGHVLRPLLKNDADEEAKGFSFQFLFGDNIKKHNIGRLKSFPLRYTLEIVVDEDTTKHHQQAYSWVYDKFVRNFDMLKLYNDLSTKKVRVSKD